MSCWRRWRRVQRKQAELSLFLEHERYKITRIADDVAGIWPFKNTPACLCFCTNLREKQSRWCRDHQGVIIAWGNQNFWPIVRFVFAKGHATKVANRHAYSAWINTSPTDRRIFLGQMGRACGIPKIFRSAFVQFRGKVDRNDNYERLLIMTWRERLISRVDENKTVVSPPASWRYRSYAKRIDEIECEGIRLMCERYSIKTEPQTK